jgi:hypothetical protein
MIIHLVWDTSGSMAEWGKYLIARGVARAMEQYLRLGYDSAKLKLVAWGNEARLFDWRCDQEFPPELLMPEGSANAQALISLLGTEPGGKVLILTDGFWSPVDAKELKRWKACLQPDTIRVIKVGADANPHLKGVDVFAAEDLFAALDCWLQGGMA